VIPPFQPNGDLPPGIHWAEWDEFKVRFGRTRHRARLLRGLASALVNLKQAGCRTDYINGSFVTSKEVPNDYDACWDPIGVDGSRLDPVLLNFASGRAAQKTKYLGELFPATWPADSRGSVFLDFFQVNRDTGLQKGIVALDLRRLP
jgi:hypothetical protein